MVVQWALVKPNIMTRGGEKGFAVRGLWQDCLVKMRWQKTLTERVLERVGAMGPSGTHCGPTVGPLRIDGVTVKIGN